MELNLIFVSCLGPLLTHALDHFHEEVEGIVHLNVL